ncbi:unnamed protein product [Adineta ricciae]|uniref:Uncharacterized protein n=1 Tax=Adineta ricciae TaxID=249248 RepID=A0A814NQV0_ADIRI|nr:unnamed protein product [Adineta ricciae]
MKCDLDPNLSDFNGVTNVSFADDPLVTDYLPNPRVEILVENKADEKLSPSIFEGNPLLYFLFSSGEVEKIDSIFQRGHFVSTETYADYHGRPPMHLATIVGHLNIIKLLLQYRYYGTADRFGRYAIDEVKQRNFQEIVQLLEK